MRNNGEKRSMPPADVMRQLRQDAAFGCCKCGYPFYEFHHIILWSVEEHYRPADMMILCPNCHAEVTNAKVSETEQRIWKENPVNKRNGLAHGKLRIEQTELTVQFGGSTFTEVPVLLQIKGENIIAARREDDGRILISIRSYDEHDNLIFQIEDNVWITGTELPWDLTAQWQHVTLRHKQRDIGLEIDARSSPVKVRGTFWKGGTYFKGTESYLVDGANNRLYSFDAARCEVGIALFK